MEPSGNIILFADSYKISHHLQYPPGLTQLKSYFESRGGKHARVLFFGLQYVLKRYLSQRVTMDMVDEAEQLLAPHFALTDRPVFNREGWTYIVKELGGKLPVRIRAVPEGILVPVKNVLFTVESTDEKVPWVANYVETCLVQVWYPMTVATNSFAQKEAIRSHAVKTGADLDRVSYQLHDFGFRGCTSLEAAGVGGAAHLTVFRGSDTLAALQVARRYYGPSDLMAGTSVPATEHSTTTSWGRDGEQSSVGHVIKSFPSGPLSVVADSYDVWSFIDDILGKEFKQQIESRKGTIVVRPDSGDPVETVLKVLSKLEANFGSSKNAAGYKSLPSYIRIIQGDGVSYESICKILDAMTSSGWCSGVITFGSGGALLQKLDRDTQRCAFKCCMAVVDGEKLDVFKDPVTDPGKRSKRGDITLVRDREDGELKSVRKEDIKDGQVDQMVTVFENGETVKEWTFHEVRERVEAHLATAKQD